MYWRRKKSLETIGDIGMQQETQAQWSSRLAFILAATGSAVGLGNIWKFPYVAGENGGGAFVLVYLACVLLIGLPLMMAEILMGRRGQQNPVGTFASLAQEAGGRKWWRLIGGMGILTGFLILSFYSVVGGWALAYAKYALTGVFSGADNAAVGAVLGGLLGNGWAVVGWHSLFMALTVLIVAGGIQGGLERAVKYIMPALLAILIFLVGYAAAVGDFAGALAFLFTPDFARLTPLNIVDAMGLAFFSLSLGMGAIMMYGAYLGRDISIFKVAGSVVLADTFVAIIAGLAIFPIVLANGLEPSKSVGLVFLTVPMSLANMDYGAVLLVAFFVLLVLAALTSAISLLEPATSWWIKRSGWKRPKTSILIGGIVWALGLLSALSFNVLGDVSVCSGWFADNPPEMCDGENDLFDLFDKLTSNVLLPLGGMFIALFVSMRMRREHVREELDIANANLFRLWFFALRYMVPLAIGLIFFNAIGVLPWLYGVLTTNG